MKVNNIPRNTFIGSLALLAQNGVEFGSVIDIGCADGTFSLECLILLGGGVIPFNIDAQETYKNSLEKIKQRIGGEYRITAVGAHEGTLRFKTGKHAYWSRAWEGEDDPYEETAVSSLDTLLNQTNLPQPYLIKMDIEGGEFAALQGACNTLEKSAALILETDIYYGRNSGGKFNDIYNYLAARNFSLFDIVSMGYRTDQVLYQIYSVFINNNYDFRQKLDTKNTKNLKNTMEQRRNQLLARNDQILSFLENAKPNNNT